MRERRRIEDSDIPMLYRQLTKMPAEPPCDVCPWMKTPNEYQGCENVGCSFMITYFAVSDYQIRNTWVTEKDLLEARGKSRVSEETKREEMKEKHEVRK